MSDMASRGEYRETGVRLFFEKIYIVRNSTDRENECAIHADNNIELSSDLIELLIEYRFFARVERTPTM